VGFNQFMGKSLQCKFQMFGIENNLFFHHNKDNRF